MGGNARVVHKFKRKRQHPLPTNPPPQPQTNKNTHAHTQKPTTRHTRIHANEMDGCEEDVWDGDSEWKAWRCGSSRWDRSSI